LRSLALFAGWMMALAFLAAPAQADYVDDARTARGASFVVPRAPLGDLLRELSKGTGVALTVAPSIGEQQIVGYVPRRPLRETMQALEELFDGAWKTLPGTPPSYRLDPDPVRMKAISAKHDAQLKEYRKITDAPAAEAAQRVKKHEALPGTAQLQWQLLGALLWSHLNSTDRNRVLAGQTITITIPAAQAGPIHDLILAIATKKPAPLLGPMLATFDLDDETDLGLPKIRARATGMRQDSIVGAISQVDFIRPNSSPKVIEAPAGDPQLPANIGEMGRFNGERDEVMIRLAEAAEIPILSRHRVQGGSSRTIVAGGRKLTDAMFDLAVATDADFEPNARGFQLFRSRTEALDRGGYLPTAPVQNYLRKRPAPGKAVSIAALAELAPLSPLQLSVLERSNLASADAKFARNSFALLRFYELLSLEQRQLLFSPQGLAADGLSHAQLHALLDEKRKRSDFDIHGELQQIRGLFFRVTEDLAKEEEGLVLEALREGQPVVTATDDLPRVEKEDVLQVQIR
jgi:hypothetical protein